MPEPLRQVPYWAWIFAGALTLRWWGLAHGLPDAPNPDETMMVRRALRFGSGDLNPHFFYYPSFSMYLFFVLEGAYYVLGRMIGIFQSTDDFARSFVQDPTTVYVVARSLVSLADAGSVVLIAKWSQAFFDQRTALWAALYWAVCPTAIEYSQVAKPDSLMLFLMLLSLWLLRNPDEARRVARGGFVLGLAVSTKYHAILLGPALLYWIGSALDPRRAWRAAALLIAGGALGCVFGTPYALLDGRTFLHDVVAQAEVMGIGVTGAEGGDRGWVFYLGLLTNPAGYGLVSLLALAGLILQPDRRRPKIMLVLFLLVLFFALGSRRIYSAHYVAIGFPFLFMLAGAGLSVLWERLQGHQVALVRLVVPACFLISAAPALVEVGLHVSWVGAPDTRTLAREWIERHVPPGATILMDASGPSLRMTRAQLDSLYARARQAGHVKADLFRLQRDADEGHGYRVFLTEQPIMVTPGDLLAYSRSVQDLLPMDRGLDYLREQGVDYVLVSEAERRVLTAERGLELYPRHAQYYVDLEQQARLLQEFPSGPRHPGPHIWIYHL